jgi:hypothetical protein
MSLHVYQIYDQETDAYTAWAADSEQDAIAQYIAENPPDLTVSLIWPTEHEPVEGDDVLRFPIEDWRKEVANGDTLVGYAQWLAAKLVIDFDGI